MVPIEVIASHKPAIIQFDLKTIPSNRWGKYSRCNNCSLITREFSDKMKTGNIRDQKE